jgi:hypothetical protein
MRRERLHGTIYHYTAHNENHGIKLNNLAFEKMRLHAEYPCFKRTLIISFIINTSAL